MHKFLSLTYVTLKNAGGMVEVNSKKKFLKPLTYFVLALCMLPSIIFLYTMFKEIFHVLYYMDQFASILAFNFQMGSVLIFLSSILLIPSIFYFSKDNETLLSLPIPPQAILASKFVACYVYEYIFVLLFLLPCMIAYIPYVNLSISSILSIILLFLLLPVYPLALASILTMVTMRFVPFFKNRDRFHLIANIVSIIVAIAIVLFFNSPNNMSDPTTTLALLLDGNNSLLNTLGYLFPTLTHIALAIHEGSVYSLFLFLAFTFLSVIVCLWIAHKVYFKGLIGFNETSSKRKKMNTLEYHKKTIQQNRIYSYIKKELVLIVRTPAYVMNCLSSIVMTPLFIIIISFTNQGNIKINSLPQEVYDILPHFIPYIILIGLLCGFFIGSLSFVSSTAISREGSNISFMNSIPMPLKDQLYAKVCSGILLSLLGDFFTFICIIIAFPFLPLPYLLICLLASIPSVIFANYVGLYLDLLKPKLIWEQEAVAVKQNLAGMVSAILGVSSIFAIGFIVVITPVDYALLIASICCIIVIVAILILHNKLDQYGKYCFKKYGG